MDRLLRTRRIRLGKAWPAGLVMACLLCPGCRKKESAPPTTPAAVKTVSSNVVPVAPASTTVNATLPTQSVSAATAPATAQPALTNRQAVLETPEKALAIYNRGVSFFMGWPATGSGSRCAMFP